MNTGGEWAEERAESSLSAKLCTSSRIVPIPIRSRMARGDATIPRRSALVGSPVPDKGDWVPAVGHFLCRIRA